MTSALYCKRRESARLSLINRASMISYLECGQMSHLEYNKIFFYDYKWIFLKIYKNYNKLFIYRYLFLSEIIIIMNNLF